MFDENRASFHEHDVANACIKVNHLLAVWDIILNDQELSKEQWKKLPKGVFGVRYVSPLINLLKFNLITSFIPDYMHCCLLGVAKQIVELLLDLLSKHELHIFDQLLLLMKVPHQLARLTRTLTERAGRRAIEWENFVLFYSLPLFKLFSSNEHFIYWSLFVKSLYISF